MERVLLGGKTGEVGTKGYGAGTLRRAIVDGDVDRGSVMAGQSAGLVNDVVPVRELIERIVAEAEAILRRNAGLVAPPESRIPNHD